MEENVWGGMRQAGVLAAAGLYALDHHVDRLGEDHVRARQLAEGLDGINGILLNVNSVQTNMVYLKTEDLAENVVKSLAAESIDVLAIGSHLVRMVTHLHIDEEGVERTLHAFKNI